jgi:hypothetical protein
VLVQPVPCRRKAPTPHKPAVRSLSLEPRFLWPSGMRIITQWRLSIALERRHGAHPIALSSHCCITQRRDTTHPTGARPLDQLCAVSLRKLPKWHALHAIPPGQRLQAPSIHQLLRSASAAAARADPGGRLRHGSQGRSCRCPDTKRADSRQMDRWKSGSPAGRTRGSIDRPPGEQQTLMELVSTVAKTSPAPHARQAQAQALSRRPVKRHAGPIETWITLVLSACTGMAREAATST